MERPAAFGKGILAISNLVGGGSLDPSSGDRSLRKKPSTRY